MQRGIRPELRSIHAKNALIVGIALLGAVPFGSRTWLSIALGGGIQAVNLMLLERSVKLWLGQASEGEIMNLRPVTTLRLMLLLVLVAGVLIWLPLDPIGFTVGISSSVPAALWHGLAGQGGEPAGLANTTER